MGRLALQPAIFEKQICEQEQDIFLINIYRPEELVHHPDELFIVRTI